MLTAYSATNMSHRHKRHCRNQSGSSSYESIIAINPHRVVIRARYPEIFDPSDENRIINIYTRKLGQTSKSSITHRIAAIHTCWLCCNQVLQAKESKFRYFHATYSVPLPQAAKPKHYVSYHRYLYVPPCYDRVFPSKEGRAIIFYAYLRALTENTQNKALRAVLQPFARVDSVATHPPKKLLPRREYYTLHLP